jgi:hypothetical protein
VATTIMTLSWYYSCAVCCVCVCLLCECECLHRS